MQSVRTIREDSIEDAGTLIADLVYELMLAHRAMWAEYER